MSSNRYPIIYVRGYAMTEAERDDTAADPFCGFNVGSTVYRATVNRENASLWSIDEAKRGKPVATAYAFGKVRLEVSAWN